MPPRVALTCCLMKVQKELNPFKSIFPLLASSMMVPMRTSTLVALSTIEFPATVTSLQVNKCDVKEKIFCNNLLFKYLPWRWKSLNDRTSQCSKSILKPSTQVGIINIFTFWNGQHWQAMYTNAIKALVDL